jgi:hypothetical protein
MPPADQEQTDLIDALGQKMLALGHANLALTGGTINETLQANANNHEIHDIGDVIPEVQAGHFKHFPPGQVAGMRAASVQLRTNADACVAASTPERREAIIHASAALIPLIKADTVPAP